MLDNCPFISFIATSDAQKSREFYERVLGLRFVSQDAFALVFESNGQVLRIQRVQQVDPHGYTSLGWLVVDIRKSVRELSQHGVTFMRYHGLTQDEDAIWSSPNGSKIAWFADPDNNVLSLTQFD